ncbi:MAG: zinc-dependent metalloprotease [Myxococcota bacterium]
MIPLLSLVLGACSPGTVDTVQPNAVAKSALDGEWFWRHTVSDVPYGTAATFLGAQGPLERIRWEIEEDLLLGYRAYPHVDASGADDGATPVVAFPILDQFDIRRGYDRTTGEESNVVEENRERPWYDREYLRVDWSTNVAQGSLLLAGLPVEVSSWVTGDDRAADAPQFDDSDGDGTIDSLMLTQHALVAPDTVTYPGYGDLPVCLFFGQAAHECGPSEVGITHSFVRVDTRAPVAGLPYDDHHMQTFGFFSTERLAYDRGYGLVEPNRVRYADRHPLWAQTIRTDALGHALCTVDDRTAPCELFSVDDHPVPAEIPVLEREVRPIVYHPSLDFPDDLRPVMGEVAAAWNEPLRDAINGQRYWACLDAGGRPNDCHALEDPDLQAFVWCPNNPSLPGDPAVCGTDHTGPQRRPDGLGDPVRVGDLRYHLAVVVHDPQLSSPYGYGPSAADPSGSALPLADGDLPLGAGEIVSGNAFLYEHVLDRVSHQVADLVQLLNGEISPDAYVDGEDLTAWVQAANQGTGAALAGHTYGLPGTWSQDAVAERMALISNGFAGRIAPELAGLQRPSSPAAFRDWLDQAGDAIDRSGVFGAGAAEADANFGALLASPFDELAWTDETIGGTGFDPAATPADALSGRSPFDLVDPRNQAEREAWRVLAGQQAVDLDEGTDAAFSDGALLGLARDYARRGLAYDEIVQDVRLNSFREVMLHEIGHTLGLRHNFSGSFDAFNFRPEYWALRDDGHMAPRHVDPETDAEIDGRIREFQYSTVMDYPGSRNVGWAGLGHYDAAAVKFGYAGLVEVLTAVPETPAISGLPNADGISFISAYASSNVLPSVILSYTSGAILDLHYTDYPALAGDLQARADVPLSRLVPTIDDSGSFGDGLVIGEGQGAGVLRAGMPAVPYRFCSDEYALGITCARFDEGADPYESVSFLIERYWNDYLLSNFARQRYGYSDGGYVNRLDDRIFEPLRDWERYYALFHGIFDVDHDPYAQAFFTADKGWGGWTAATDASFRFLTQVITRPEPGPHAMVRRPDGVDVLSPGVGDDEDAVPLIAGAYFESDWDSDSGYFWYEHQARVGTYWDRMLALYSLSNTASFSFLGYDTATDPRRYAIGFQDLYRDPLAMLLGRLVADDVGALAPVRLADGSLAYPDPLRPDQAWPPAGAQRVAPATYWLVRYDADLFGLALMAHGYDRTFLNRARVYVDGGADAIEPGPDQALVSFTDPRSGKTFTAWSFPWTDDAGEPVRAGDGSPVELGASARMLAKAQGLADRCADAALPEDEVAAACTELDRFTADLDLHLDMYASFQ